MSNFVSNELALHIMDFLASNARNREHFENALKNKIIIESLKDIDLKIDFENKKANQDEFFKNFDNFWRNMKIGKQKTLGIEFTPEKIADYIIKLTIGNEYSGEFVLDPSTGSGVFMRRILNYIVKNFHLSPTYVIENILFGVDIVEEYVFATKLGLILTSYAFGEMVGEMEVKNVVQGDALKLDLKNFKYIIGNPPYVKWQFLSEDYREWLSKNVSKTSGTYNLYMAFMEVFLRNLQKNGKLGFIISNGLFTSKSAWKFRDWLKDNFQIESIVDFDDKKMFNASVYSCIIIVSKNKQYAPVKLFKPNLENIFDSKYDEATINTSDKIWHILTRREHQDINKIENAGERIDHICDLAAGIATLRDKLFIVDLTKRKNGYFIKKYENQDYLIETQIVRPLMKISNKTENLGVIFPYQKKENGISVISESQMESKFPFTLSYFKSVEAELMKRDKGKKRYEAWYAYGRNQSLDAEGIKILTPTFSKKPSFFIDWMPERLFCNGYGLIFKTKNRSSTSLRDTIPMFDDLKNKIMTTTDIKIILRILNSKVMEYYISLTSENLSGGYKCYQKKYIEKFSIPNFSENKNDLLLMNDNEFEEYIWNLYRLPNKLLSDYVKTI
ncbi:HsdM family class I SAM-dependent methyltransferase [Athalassotoga sp.]|uniref:HsdM family class I SAM-dependent methyltransferase n=1 Tax=Athalassotoga sp. TaxID=2022597 RepID=UPI003D003F4E